MPIHLGAWLRRWLVPSSTGQHWDFLDGLRGIAIILVVLAHGVYANPSGAVWLRWVSAWCSAGTLGVQVFFVLSGFLISQPFFKQRFRQPGTWYLDGYATRRFLKIFPPYYLVILVLSAYYLWRYGDWNYVKTGLQWAVGIPHFFLVEHPFNGVFWSLWVELGFYVSLPVLFWLFRARTAWQTGITIAILFYTLPLLGRSLGWPSDPKQLLYFLGRFPNGLTNFAWGVLFGCLYAGNRDRIPVRSLFKLGYLGAVLLFVTLCFTAVTLMRGTALTRSMWECSIALSGFSTFLMMFFIFDSTAAGTRFLSIPLLRYVGLISYEWFLLHQPFINEFHLWMGSANGNLARYLLIVGLPIVVSLILAGLLYHLYSAPIIRWGRDRLAHGDSPPPHQRNLAPAIRSDQSPG